MFVSTISTSDDLTLVLGVEGFVNAAGATSLELGYPDGTVTEVPLAPDGSYRFMIPPDRQKEFATSSGKLVAHATSVERSSPRRRSRQSPTRTEIRDGSRTIVEPNQPSS